MMHINAISARCTRASNHRVRPPKPSTAAISCQGEPNEYAASLPAWVNGLTSTRICNQTIVAHVDHAIRIDHEQMSGESQGYAIPPWASAPATAVRGFDQWIERRLPYRPVHVHHN